MNLTIKLRWKRVEESGYWLNTYVLTNVGRQ